jgi:hypothetical protein
MFTKSKIMDMVNKSVSYAVEHPEAQDAMYHSLYYVACFSISREQFDRLVKARTTDDRGLYRMVLAEVTTSTYGTSS